MTHTHEPWNEFDIARAISRQTLQRKCVLLVDNCMFTGHECDVLGVTMDLRLIDIEVKISRADLKADAGKDKWWHRTGWMWWGREGPPPPDVPRLWPPRVWKHYYAVPKEIWMDTLFGSLPSPKSGVLVLTARKDGLAPLVECVRRCTPNKDADKLKPAEVMDIARLANLRMWDAYEREDRAHDECRRRLALLTPA